MSKNATLHAIKRETSGSAAANRLRLSGIVPGVVYGSQQDNYSIQVSMKEISDLLHHSTTDNLLVNLQIEGAKEANKMALIQAVQHDPLTGQIIHVDFHAVKAGEKIHATVSLVLVGTPKGVELGGLLDHQLHSIDVHCKPEHLPSQLEVDVTSLEIGDAAHVKDVKMPEGVEADLGGEVVVALVQEIRIGKTEAAEEGGAASEVAQGEAARGES